MKRDFAVVVASEALPAPAYLLQLEAEMVKLATMHHMRNIAFISSQLSSPPRKPQHALSKNYRLISSDIVFPSPSTHLPKSHEPTPHRSARYHLVPALSSIRYRCPSLIPSQDVRQRIRHRVHRCRCLRHHPHGGRSDQEGRVSFCNKSRAGAIYFVLQHFRQGSPVSTCLAQ